MALADNGEPDQVAAEARRFQTGTLAALTQEN